MRQRSSRLPTAALHSLSGSSEYLQINFLPYIREEEGPKEQIKPQKMHLMIHVSCAVAQISGNFRRIRLNLSLSVVEKLLLELWRLVSQVREAFPKRVLVKICGAEIVQEMRRWKSTWVCTTW